MPQLGLTMESGAVVEWLVGEGDAIETGQEILVVETDKANVAVEAHQAGTVARILVPEGREVPVGTALAVTVAPGETLPADWASMGTETAAAPDPQAPVQEATPPTKPQVEAPMRASWKARAMAHEAGLDLRLVAGSGPGGRIGAEDVARALQATAPLEPAEIRATPVAANLASALGLELSQVGGSGAQGQITQTDVLAAAAAIIRARGPVPPTPTPGLPQVMSTTPLRGARKIVSEGMASSARTTARVTLFREVDATQFAHLHERFAAEGRSVSYNDILIQICAVALREHPGANARLGEGQIEYLDRINIGLAVNTERGLLVPVIHNAGRLSLAQITAERARLVEAARAGRSLPDDLSGGTFTITNLGMLGVEGFTPVIKLPECCILGVGRVVRKPVALGDGDRIAVRPTMTLSLAFDHRVIDGAPAARFLDRITQLVQDPLLLLTLDTNP
jgi:pyruvate dehydrogenase E2 component (dihydrolipoamide acetyltransferase)